METFTELVARGRRERNIFGAGLILGMLGELFAQWVAGVGPFAS